MPQLYRLISGYAAQLKITIPCIVLVNDSKMFEAANVGWNTDSGFIIVGRGVFEEYTDDQLRGLMGYHMGHLAQRTSARLVTLFTPALLAGFALAFYGIGQIDVKNNNMMVASLQAMTILGAYGISMSIIWAFLMRGNESRADQALAKIDPTLGLALLAAIKRARLEDCSGDVAASSRIIASLPALNDSERSAALHSLTILGSMNNTESALREVVDSGFFGTQHSLEHRQAFFESQLLDV